MSITPDLPVLRGKPTSKMAEEIRRGDYPFVPDELVNLVAAEDALAYLDIRPDVTFNDTVQSIAADLFAGRALPEDLPARAEAAIAAEERSRLGQLLRENLLNQIDARWPKAATEHVDSMLDALRAQLDEILAEVRGAAAVVNGLDLTDPEAVGEAPDAQRAAVAALKALRPRYRRTRILQQQLLETVREQPWPANTQDGRVEHPLTTSWKRLFASGLHEFRVHQTGRPAIDSRAVLWWLPLVDERSVWLPSTTELKAAIKELAPVWRPE